jgi:hypothetical protein
MPKFAAVSHERHAAQRWPRPRNFLHRAKDATVPIVTAELAKIVPSGPIAFIQTGQRFQLVALLSITPGKNMFIGPDGRWLVGYIPADIRSYPFRMLMPEGGTEPILCIDEDCKLLTGDSKEGESFFDADGSIAPALQQVLNFLGEIERSRVATQLAVGSLQQASLIVPWPIKIQTAKGEQALDGLFRVDEAAMNALSADIFEKLRAVGALVIAYAQLFSMNQLSVFRTLAELQTKLSPKRTAPLPDTLDTLFDMGNNDYIKFD